MTRSLRHTFTPYISFIIIFLALTTLAGFACAKTSDWRSFCEITATVGVLLAFFPYLGLRYKVLWDGSAVTMHASGGRERRISYQDISSIEFEVGAAKSRPFRRIVIHGQNHDANGFVDVSLRHFNLEDIRALMRTIHERRPDLAIPKAPRWSRDSDDWLFGSK